MIRAGQTLMFGAGAVAAAAATSEWRSEPALIAQPLPRGMSGIAIDERRAVLAGGVEAGVLADRRCAA